MHERSFVLHRYRRGIHEIQENDALKYEHVLTLSSYVMHIYILCFQEFESVLLMQTSLPLWISLTRISMMTTLTYMIKKM